MDCTDVLSVSNSVSGDGFFQNTPILVTFPVPMAGELAFKKTIELQ